MALINDGYTNASGLLNNQQLSHLTSRFDAIVVGTNVVNNVEVSNPDVANYFKTDVCKSSVLTSISLPGNTVLDTITMEKRTQNVSGWHREVAFDSANPLKDVILTIHLDASTAGINAVSFLKGSQTIANPIVDPANVVSVAANAGDGVIGFGSTYVDYPTTSEAFTLRLIHYKFKYSAN